MKKTGVAVVVILLLYAACVAAAQDKKEILRLSGVLYEEELGEEEAERLESFRSSPLRINMVSRSVLVSSGLMTPYQAASLIDYRDRNGDILSVAELAAVDGFGQETAGALVPFVSFQSFALPGRNSAGNSFVSNSLTVKSMSKASGPLRNAEHSYGLKYRFSLNDRFESGISCRSPYSASVSFPDVLSGFAAYYGKRAIGKVIIGDFNARFGQGLAMWSGFSMSGTPACGAFSRKASGLSPYRSYSGTGSHRGAAVEFNAGDFVFSAFAAFEGLRGIFPKGTGRDLSLLPCLNAAWFGTNGHVSATWFMKGVSECILSADGDWFFGAAELFAESAFDFRNRCFASLAGCRASVGESFGIAAALRYYPNKYFSSYSGALRSSGKCRNEHGVSVSCEFSAGGYVPLKGKTGFGSSERRHRADLSADLAFSPEPRHGIDTSSAQLKAVLSYSYRVSPSVAICLRCLQRLRTYGEKYKSDVRCDVIYGAGNFKASARFDILHCKGISMLSYIESGYGGKRVSAYLKFGAFRADEWADRIYAYERDAPGNFSVPAYYGRGFWVSSYLRAKVCGWGKLYLRAAYTGYPWMRTGKKPGRAELRIQIVLDFMRFRA